MRPQIKKPLAKGLFTTADNSYSKSIEQIRQEASLAVAKFTEATQASNQTSAKVISIQSYEKSAVLQKASELKPKPINWIWEGWIAAGKFHLLGGVAGTGKTTISLALVSSITNGGKFPDGSTASKGNVVVWTGEDDVCDTLTPRLMAMGADLDKVYFIQGMKTGNDERPFEPSLDMPLLKYAIEKIGNVKVLIIDPIVSVIKGDSHKNAEVRRDLTPLVQMAEQMGFAIIGITHFTKGTSGREPIERITGSLAFGAVARVVLVASKTKNDDGDEIRIFLRAKSNIGIDEGGFEYSLKSATTDSGIETSRVSWGSLIEGSARELLAESEEESDGGGIKGCMALISDLLAYGEVNAKQMEKDCTGAGYTYATIRRAKKRLGVDSRKRGMGSKGVWMWILPSKVLNISKDAHTQIVNTLSKSEYLNDFEIVKGEL